MKSRHNTTPDRPAVNATDDTPDALFRACMLMPPVRIPNQQPAARETFIADVSQMWISGHTNRTGVNP